MKMLFIVLGTLSLILGVVGVVVPLLPTTPFILLSATLYMHSSPKLYDWLLNNKYLGSYIRNYREHKLISLKVKIVSMVTLWATILASIFWVCEGRLTLQILLFVIAVCVSWHILSHRSVPPKE